MPLKVEIDADLKAAMLDGDKDAVTALRSLKGVILDAEVANGVRDKGLSDGDLEKLIAREAKKRKEAAEIFVENERDDLAEGERVEVRLFEKYLPRQLSEDELLAIILEEIQEVPGASMKNMGQVIGAVKNRVGNTADGALVAKLVKEKLV